MYNNEYAGGYYANNSGHNYYQNLYNMFGGYNPIVDKNFNTLKRLGFRTGCVMLGAILLQNLAGIVIGYTPLAELYFSDVFYMHGISSVAQFFYTLLPFFVLYLISRPKEREQMKVFSLPKSNKVYVLGVFAGLMFCLLGNTANSIFSIVLSVFGVEFTSGLEDMQTPSSLPAIIMYLINISVLPALFEEFAFRSVIMQPLRKYGDWFAIVMSSLAFAVLHGNMVQIPFAFIAGISLGYFCIKTKSIWTSVTVHFLNNLLSAIFGIVIEKQPELGAFMYYAVTSALVFIGIIAMIVFKFNCNIKVKRDATVMGKDKQLKNAAYLCTPTMVLSVFIAMLSSLGFANIANGFAFLIILAACIAIICIFTKWIGKVRHDTRIKPGSMYTVSIVVTAISSVIVILTLLGTAIG